MANQSSQICRWLLLYPFFNENLSVERLDVRDF